MMHRALCCCSTRCYHTQSSETIRIRHRGALVLATKSHRTGTMSRSEHDQKGERWSASSLPAVSIRLLTADGYQREHVDTNTSDPTPIRGQIGGEKAPQDQDATDPLAHYNVLDYALGVTCGCLEVNINFNIHYCYLVF